MDFITKSSLEKTEKCIGLLALAIEGLPHITQNRFASEHLLSRGNRSYPEKGN